MTFAVIAALAGCALGPDFHRPPDPAGAHVIAPPAPGVLLADGAQQRFDAAADVPANWWSRFGSPALDALVQRALAQSPTVAAAQATLRQSQDELRAGYAAFYPQVGAGIAASRQKSAVQSPAAGNGAPIAVGPYNLATASTTVSYVPDVFGRQRRTVEALQAQSDLQRAALQAAYLSLTANVANAAIARAAYQAQSEALQQIVKMQADQIHIAQVQFDAGTAAYTAVVLLKSQQAANQAASAALAQRIDQGEHLLAQLGGQAPADAEAPDLQLKGLTLPATLPDTLPSTLARHRPDILAAEASLHVASARIGVATADLFPSVILGGAAGASQSSIAALLNSGVSFWSAQAQMTGSIFTGFSQWYTRRAAIDAYDAALAEYRQAVLVGLQQVADAMSALGHDAQAVQAQAEAQAAAEEGLRLARINFEAGTGGYLDLLTADTQYQQARLGHDGAVAQRLQDTVALYAALGGGWWNTQ